MEAHWRILANTIEMSVKNLGKKHVLDGGPDPDALGQFLGERTCPGMPDNTAVSCAKMAEPIEMPLGW